MTNLVVLQGRVSRPVGERVLPSGDRLATLDLTVPGQEAGARAESVPLAWFGAPAWVADLEVGSEVVVVGRVRRRFFRGGPGLQSRTEVVVEGGAPARRPARVAEVLRGAMGTLTDAAAGASEARGRRAAPTFP